jgi:signal transduction histidine kinase
MRYSNTRVFSIFYAGNKSVPIEKPQNSQKTAFNQQEQKSSGVVLALKQFTEKARRVWTRTSNDNTRDYRQFYLASDVPQARVVIFLLAITIVLFAFSDYTLVGLTLVFYGLIALRVGLIIYCATQFMHVKRVRDYRVYDRSMFAFLLIIVAGILLVNLTRPQNFIPHIIVIDMAVMVFYLVMPTRFIYQAIPALTFSGGEVLIVTFTFQWSMQAGLFTALFSLVFANIVAALASLQLHSYRWRVYESLKERKETDRLAAIGQTAGMIGHDIRNPLQAIVSELYIARQSIAESRVPEGTKGPAEESIDLIEEQTDYITKIVSDLQDYARPLKPELKEVDLAKLVVSVFQTIHVPDTIVLKVDVQGFPKIMTDSTMIRRALTNLVNNAIQAMPDGGTLNLTAKKTAHEAIIAVSDTGKGIPEEIKPKLFTPLVTTKAKGQGLGLVVVKRLVEALGGSITFESEAGKGTKFTITLPVKE